MRKTAARFLTLSLLTLCGAAAALAADELTPPADTTSWLRDNRGVSLFFDTTLPGWTADELAASLREIRPEVFGAFAQSIDADGEHDPRALFEGQPH